MGTWLKEERTRWSLLRSRNIGARAGIVWEEQEACKSVPLVKSLVGLCRPPDAYRVVTRVLASFGLNVVYLQSFRNVDL